MSKSILYYELTGDPFYLNKKLNECMLNIEEEIFHAWDVLVWILSECSRWASIPKLPCKEDL